jgi:hypothetical protein
LHVMCRATEQPNVKATQHVRRQVAPPSSCSPIPFKCRDNFCCPYSLLLLLLFNKQSKESHLERHLAAALLSFLSCFPLLCFDSAYTCITCLPTSTKKKSSVSACEDEHPSSMSPSHQALLLEDEKAACFPEGTKHDGIPNPRHSDRTEFVLFARF